MSYCGNCKVLLQPSYTQCPYCDSGDLEAKPPNPTQGPWRGLPDIPGIVEGQEVGGELQEKAIQYYIDQSGEGTKIQVGTDRYDQALDIQKQVLGH
jgi:hypothetical protein